MDVGGIFQRGTIAAVDGVIVVVVALGTGGRRRRCGRRVCGWRHKRWVGSDQSLCLRFRRIRSGLLSDIWRRANQAIMIWKIEIGEEQKSKIVLVEDSTKLKIYLESKNGTGGIFIHLFFFLARETNSDARRCESI